MAGDWIKWTVGLAGKREVRVIASRLQRDRHEVAGRLMALWEWLDENLSDADIDPESGDASLLIGEEWKAHLDEIAGLPGFAEVLASDAVRWIDPARSAGRVTFPRLGRHVGKLAKTRCMEQRKKSRQRRESRPDSVPMPSGPEERREETKIHSPPPAGEDVPDELLSQAQALASAHTAGVPEDFARYVFATWLGRDGKDGAGVKVRFIANVVSRWTREQGEWRKGTHNGQKQGGENHGRNRKPDGGGRTAHAGANAAGEGY